MSSFSLKVLAVVAMIIDHIGIIFFPQYIILRYIGRLSFPIFAFLLVQGFIHTKSRTQYAIRLGIFAILSEVPYDLVFYGTYLEFEHQNIMFELLCGLLAIWAMEQAVKTKQESLFLVSLALVIASTYFNFSYGIYGIVLMIGFYLFNAFKISRCVISAGVTYLFNGITTVNFTVWKTSCVLFAGSATQLYAMWSAVPLLLYNGQRGKYKLKWMFYFIYPVHLIILYFVNLVI